MQQLINFAYDGQMDAAAITTDNFNALLEAADYTASVRMTAYLNDFKKYLFAELGAIKDEAN